MSELALISPEVPAKWTERTVLDLLHLRLCQPVNGAAQRYALAEHARLDPTWGYRILDAVAVDTWASTGYALDGYEVKVSRSDLRRELADLTKAGAWEDVLDTFSIVAPKAVLSDWRTFGIPEAWGVMAADGSGLRWLRKPRHRRSPEPVKRAVVAGLARAIAQTANRHCIRHADTWAATLDPTTDPDHPQE